MFLVKNTKERMKTSKFRCVEFEMLCTCIPLTPIKPNAI